MSTPRFDLVQTETSAATRAVDPSLIRRIEAAVAAADVSRFEVEYHWPECHKTKCQGHHGDPGEAFGLMKHRVLAAIREELQYEKTTHPDIAETGDSAEQTAVYTLAWLMNTYNVHHAGTFVRAAQLMVDAYPGLIAALETVGSRIGGAE